MNRYIFIFASLAVMVLGFRTLSGQSDPSPAEMLTEITGEAKDTGDEVKAISNSIFDILNPTIEETYELSEFIDKGSNLTKAEKEEVLGRVSDIHQVFKELSEDKDHYKAQLDFSMQEATRILRDGQKMQEHYDKETEKLKKRFDSSKNDKKISELRLNTMKLAVSLSEERSKVFTRVHQNLGEFKDFNSATRDDIKEFLEVIDESALTTGIMVELMEVEVQGEMIKANLQGLQDLSKYIENINKSLQKLGKSLMELQRMADDYS